MRYVIAAFLSFFLLFSSLAQLTYGQTDDDSNDTRIVTGGFGIGLGIFYPTDVNDFIEDVTSHLLITSGVPQMFSNYHIKGSLSFHPHRIIELNFSIEYDWAPKFIYVSDLSDYYYFAFNRIAPCFSPRIHVPFGSGRHSIFFAPGLTYNIMTFNYSQRSESVAKAYNLGWRAQIGFHLNLRKIYLKPFIGFDRAVGHDDYMDLNYTGGQLGVELHF